MSEIAQSREDGNFDRRLHLLTEQVISGGGNPEDAMQALVSALDTRE